MLKMRIAASDRGRIETQTAFQSEVRQDVTECVGEVLHAANERRQTRQRRPADRRFGVVMRKVIHAERWHSLKALADLSDCDQHLTGSARNPNI
jgi:hypothetical protein